MYKAMESPNIRLSEYRNAHIYPYMYLGPKVLQYRFEAYLRHRMNCADTFHPVEEDGEPASRVGRQDGHRSLLGGLGGWLDSGDPWTTTPSANGVANQAPSLYPEYDICLLCCSYYGLYLAAGDKCRAPPFWLGGRKQTVSQS